MQTKNLSLTIQTYPFIIALAGGYSLFSVIRIYITLLILCYLIKWIIVITKKQKDVVVVRSPVLQFSTVNKNGDLFLPTCFSGLLTVNDIEEYLRSKKIKNFEIHCSDGVVKICIKHFFCNIKSLQKEIDEIRPLGILVECRKYTFIEWLINKIKG